jgi:hypothetical protein
VPRPTPASAATSSSVGVPELRLTTVPPPRAPDPTARRKFRTNGQMVPQGPFSPMLLLAGRIPAQSPESIWCRGSARMPGRRTANGVLVERAQDAVTSKAAAIGSAVCSRRARGRPTGRLPLLPTWRIRRGTASSGHGAGPVPDRTYPTASRGGRPARRRPPGRPTLAVEDRGARCLAGPLTRNSARALGRSRRSAGTRARTATTRPRRC